MSDQATVPTSIRWMNGAEWGILDDVFKGTLPFKQRIFVTNGCGLGGAAFTIPTSAITTVFASLGASLAAGAITKSPAVAALAAVVTGGIGFLTSVVNAGYLMNVGPDDYADMSTSDYGKRLLVHESTHVWQGKHGVFALSYVVSSVIAQCKGMLHGGGVAGRNAAYTVTAIKPWGEYNAEQQANIVEKWFVDGKNETGDLWPFVRDHIRKGKT